MGPMANVRPPPSASFFPVVNGVASTFQPKNGIPRCSRQPKPAVDGVICLDDDSSCSEPEEQCDVLPRQSIRDMTEAQKKLRARSGGSQAGKTVGECSRRPSEWNSSAAPDEAKRPHGAAPACQGTNNRNEVHGVRANGDQERARDASGDDLERPVKRERGAADASHNAGHVEGSGMLEEQAEREPTAGGGERGGARRGYGWPQATWTAGGDDFMRENSEGYEAEEDESEGEGSEVRVEGHSVAVDDEDIEVVDLDEGEEGEGEEDVGYDDWEDGQVEDDMDDDSENDEYEEVEGEQYAVPSGPQPREDEGREGGSISGRKGTREEIELSDDEEEEDVVCGQEEAMKREWEEAARKRQGAHSQFRSTSQAAGDAASWSSVQRDGGVGGRQAAHKAADAPVRKQEQQQQHQRQEQQQNQRQEQSHQQPHQPQQQRPQSAAQQAVSGTQIDEGKAGERAPPASSVPTKASVGQEGWREEGREGQQGGGSNVAAAVDELRSQVDGAQGEPMRGDDQTDAVRNEQHPAGAMHTAASSADEGGCAASNGAREHAGAEELQREAVRQSQEFRQADEDEWRERQRELDKQAVEAQREKKRRRAAREMAERQQKRLEEVRQQLDQAEAEEATKNDVRARVRKEVERRLAGCHDFATVLTRLGISVEGMPFPSKDQVEAAYKKGLLTFHPDRAKMKDMKQQVEAEETFKIMKGEKDRLPLMSMHQRYPYGTSRQPQAWPSGRYF